MPLTSRMDARMLVPPPEPADGFAGAFAADDGRRAASEASAAPAAARRAAPAPRQ